MKKKLKIWMYMKTQKKQNYANGINFLQYYKND